ncbi:ParB/RepB/Spo0J family partition protein [Rubellicoccus peritrichatus]|uniref:ParB/RepB/Spo0J family partition protein n=1 Tax=Rubellicoccus peritrichatus TaxID=3080537 RepID=A0AAQ3LA30_9BACT|nr:ParB/RepB/Spo0J family partition protein [Puniceicoccus sp. CR14]WOO40719.1 ParB/RepB/Spo0J family partition protein [Puniceicoccus sp. CR14]
MASSKNRLGRGLGSLIAGGGASKPSSSPKKKSTSKAAPKKVSKPAAKKTPASAVKSKAVKAEPKAEVSSSQPYREISVSKVEPNPYQPRREMDPERVKDLADSIRSEGLLQPIVVRPVGEVFQLIAGERRWRAHQQLGLKTIAAKIMDASDTSSAVISLIENLQREGLNPIEESLGYASLMGDFDLTQEAVAERVGKARASIANSLRLLQLDRETQGFVSKGMLSVGHAKVLLGLDDATQRSILARRILESGMSVREAERYVKRQKSETASTGVRSVPEAEQTVIHDLERQLSTRLNTKVHLKHTPKKGRIIIEYYGNDDLQRILEKTGLEQI